MPLPVIYSPDYVTPLPPGHRFPMAKFSTLCDVLLRDGVVAPHQFHHPEPAPIAWLTQAHAPAYVEAFCTGALDPRAQRRIGLPWSPGLVRRSRAAVGGTVLAAQLALDHGIACNTAGGTHHAFKDHGSGFCIFNDQAVAARVLQSQKLVEKVLIVDLDVHQGDGAAAIFNDDPTVFTFSMHCERNFPFRKQKSDLDVPLPDGMNDDEYLRTLEAHLADALSQVRPDLVFYDAGVDPHADDLLGKLALSDKGLHRRDLQVLNTCVARGYPVACVIGGGYCSHIPTLARRHALMHRAASEVYETRRL